MICQFRNLYLLGFILFLFVFATKKSSAQVFERVEMVAGLGTLKENNGIAVADFDGDNDLDIFVVAKGKDNSDRPKSISRLMRNNNDGTFTDVTAEAGFVDLLTSIEGGDAYFGLAGFKHGASWGDYNNDGFPDLFLTNSYKVQLWRNKGDSTFTNVTEMAGFDTSDSCRNTGATWFDYNNDGFLDIYINDWNGCGGNRLYRNNGNGGFTNVTYITNLNINNNLESYTSLPFDFNQDGFLDLYVTNDFNNSNNLYINNGGISFEDQAVNYAVISTLDDMGITMSDFNNDGDFDFFITAIDENRLYLNNGDQTFTDLAEDRNVGNTGWSWGACFADFDLDGDEDLFVTNGFDFFTRQQEPNHYFKNLHVEGNDTFQDISADLGLNEMTISVEAIPFDYDNDGDLDLIVTNSDQSIFLYENKTIDLLTNSGTINWLKVQFEGTVSNRDAIGTIVTIHTENRTLKRYYSGVGFLGQSLQGVHFGLGNETNISSIEVQWPSGLVETYNNLDSNRTIKLTEGSGYQILNIIPSQKTSGCTDPLSCTYNPQATIDDGSCTYIESQSIIGSANSSFLKNETYTYNIAEGSTAKWDVTGGEIINGQGTSSVSVKWALEEFGEISVVESNEQCVSLSTSMQVAIGADDLPEDVSIARLWNEVLLEAIRRDYARATVHARNLFHSSIAMYDAWAIYDEVARPYLMGNTVHGFTSILEDFEAEEETKESQNKAISYAMCRLILHRFQTSPGFEATQTRVQLLMEKLGYDMSLTSLLYEEGDAAALGNFIAQTVIDYGLQDGSRESTGYDNAYYSPVNTPLALFSNYAHQINDPNRWQPLAFAVFIDQAGNITDNNVPDFLNPEWGNVTPFALRDEDKLTYQRNGNNYHVYHDPSNPPYINLMENTAESEAYKWGFSMVSVWQSHLDTNDGVMWDISPKSIGNIDINSFPTNFEDYPNYYNYFEGGAVSNGHAINPVTGSSYESNIVPRGDYTRVLAEFWADGPDTETPPGHWFTLLNYVSDHPQFEKRFQGQGEVLDPLEWDVKSYFILGGGMHDSAISAWSIKGWYDYIRPISAIRSMAKRGQSTDMGLDNYHVAGIPLIENYIEVVEEGDPLAGNANRHLGKIKLYTWKGHDYISDTDTDLAGVGWILAEDWYPYQRPTFVTPPFAGFVSGHSTYSRAGAELMTMITGNEFFPGGMGEFVAKKNEFLVFEEGPSVDVVLQWATYRDASDQTSLSRIWGGIHPPADDIPGRLIGKEVAESTFSFAVPYFQGALNMEKYEIKSWSVYPNPTRDGTLTITNTLGTESIDVYDVTGRKIEIKTRRYISDNSTTFIELNTVATGLYILKVDGHSEMIVFKD